MSAERLVLTPGDRLFLLRRREGKSQRQAAAEWKVSYGVYSAWENNHATLLPPPAVQVRRLEPHERALVYRRQKGLTQAQVAKAIERCGYTVRKMELGLIDPAPLLAFWEGADGPARN
jgi:transcriptional regulator with XRE-family HTH domain